MPRAVAGDVRRQIAERHAAGEALPRIAADLGVSPWTARTIWRRSRDRGEAGLVPDDAARGRAGRTRAGERD